MYSRSKRQINVKKKLLLTTRANCYATTNDAIKAQLDQLFPTEEAKNCDEYRDVLTHTTWLNQWDSRVTDSLDDSPGNIISTCFSLLHLIHFIQTKNVKPVADKKGKGKLKQENHSDGIKEIWRAFTRNWLVHSKEEITLFKLMVEHNIIDSDFVRCVLDTHGDPLLLRWLLFLSTKPELYRGTLIEVILLIIHEKRNIEPYINLDKLEQHWQTAMDRLNDLSNIINKDKKLNQYIEDHVFSILMLKKIIIIEFLFQPLSINSQPQHQHPTVDSMLALWHVLFDRNMLHPSERWCEYNLFHPVECREMLETFQRAGITTFPPIVTPLLNHIVKVLLEKNKLNQQAISLITFLNKKYLPIEIDQFFQTLFHKEVRYQIFLDKFANLNERDQGLYVLGIIALNHFFHGESELWIDNYLASDFKDLETGLNYAVNKSGGYNIESPPYTLIIQCIPSLRSSPTFNKFQERRGTADHPVWRNLKTSIYAIAKLNNQTTDKQIADYIELIKFLVNLDMSIQFAPLAFAHYETFFKLYESAKMELTKSRMSLSISYSTMMTLLMQNRPLTDDLLHYLRIAMRYVNRLHQIPDENIVGGLSRYKDNTKSLDELLKDLYLAYDEKKTVEQNIQALPTLIAGKGYELPKPAEPKTTPIREVIYNNSGPFSFLRLHQRYGTTPNLEERINDSALELNDSVTRACKEAMTEQTYSWLEQTAEEREKNLREHHRRLAFIADVYKRMTKMHLEFQASKSLISPALKLTFRQVFYLLWHAIKDKDASANTRHETLSDDAIMKRIHLFFKVWFNHMANYAKFNLYLCLGDLLRTVTDHVDVHIIQDVDTWLLGHVKERIVTTVFEYQVMNGFVIDVNQWLIDRKEGKLDAYQHLETAIETACDKFLTQFKATAENTPAPIIIPASLYASYLAQFKTVEFDRENYQKLLTQYQESKSPFEHHQTSSSSSSSAGFSHSFGLWANEPITNAGSRRPREQDPGADTGMKRPHQSPNE